MTKFYFSPTRDADSNKIKPSGLEANGFFANVIFMDNENLIQKFQTTVQNGDEVQIHGHGLPHLFGSIVPEVADYSPYKLAHFFANSLNDKKIEITIDLRFCHSGTTAATPDKKISICYVEEFNQALKDYGFQNITTHGYAAVLTDSSLKQSAKSRSSNSNSKASHARLEEVRKTYLGGKLVAQESKNLVPLYSFKKSERKFSQIEYNQHQKEIRKASKKEADGLPLTQGITSITRSMQAPN